MARGYSVYGRWVEQYGPLECYAYRDVNCIQAGNKTKELSMVT